MQDISDTELLRQYAEDDSEAAFETLVTRYVNLVYSAALRKTGNSQSAEEVAQAVFIILAKKAGALRKGTVLSGWLYQTARLTAANFLRNEIRRVRREHEASMESPLNETLPNEPELWPQITPLLEDAMGRLNEKERNAIVLRFFEEKSFHEIGTALGATENAAKKRVAYALEKLRKFFAKRGVSSTTAIIAVAISGHSVQAAPVGLTQTISAVAFAKGATSSASTLTLVKGALKIMAWTKTKTAIIAGAAALLALAAGTEIVSSVTAARTTAALATMQGNWEGTLNIPPGKLRVVFKILQTNGVYYATLDSIDQGAKDIPIPKLRAHSHSIQMEVPALGVDYQATLNSDGTAMTGTFKQLNRSILLVLNRTATPDAVESMTASQYAPQASSPLQGAWGGTLKAGGVSLRLNLRIAETAPGTFQAQMDSVDQGAMNLPVTSLTFEPPTVRLDMDSIGGRFQGNLNDSLDELKGTWTQAGRKFPLTFDRVQTNAQATAEVKKDYGQGASDQIQGHWKGALHIQGTDLHIVFHIAQMPDGSYSATLDSPDQGATGVPATSADFTFPNVRLEWKQFGGFFSGKLENGRLSGTWHQGQAALSLHLERT